MKCCIATNTGEQLSSAAQSMTISTTQSSVLQVTLNSQEQAALVNG